MNAALYIRVSTEEQAMHGLSVAAQTAALDTWAKQNQVKVVDHYVDAGISARKKASTRPELQRLLRDIEAGNIDLVVFTKLDRWFRNIGEYYRVQDILDKHKVNWKTIQEDYDTSTASGRLKINIMLSVAQDEADRTSERIKAVFASKLERMEPISGQVPTGFMIQNKKIVKDPAVQEGVSAFFAHYLQNGCITAAIDEAAKYGLHLKYQLASKMLTKTAYYGCVNGIEGMCPPYITKGQYDWITQNRRKIVRKTLFNRVYLFSGLLVCAECSARMGGRTKKYKQMEFVEYNCPGHYQKKGCNNRTNIREAQIENYILENAEVAMQQFLIKYEKRASEKKHNYQAEIAAAKHKLSRLKELYINDLIDMATYKADYETITGKIQLLEAERKQQPPDLSHLKEALYPGWQDAYIHLDRVHKRAFWRQLLSEIRIYPDRHIEINFLQNLTT